MYTIEQDASSLGKTDQDQRRDEEQGTIEALRDACSDLRAQNLASAYRFRQAIAEASEAGRHAEQVSQESAAAISHLVLQNNDLRQGIGRLRSAMLGQEVAWKAAQAPATPAPPAVDGPPGSCLEVHARALASAVAGLEKAAIQDDALAARELLAAIATGGRLGWQDTAALFDRAAGRISAPHEDHLQVDALTAMARVMSNRPPDEFDELSALRIYDALLATAGEGAFSPSDRIRHVELLTRHGHPGRAGMRLAGSCLAHDLPADYAALKANLMHSEGDEGWLASFNGIFGTALEPVSLVGGPAPCMDRLLCRPHRVECAEGPLVSVLMTAYRTGSLVDTAVRSVLAQTWRNIEVIIVDDSSGDGTAERLRLLGARDARIRILRTGCNSGTYVARNLALLEARGMFVTCHDSDDWSHPRKIELQVRHLLDAQEQAANLSTWMRASDGLVLQRFSATGRYLYPNTSSLMFRRVPVIEALGGWDTVRSGADTEFYKRIELVFRQKLEVLGHAPLSLGRMRAGALTSGTLGRGWASPERRLYRDSWRAWHKRIAAGETGARLYPSVERPFRAPVSILPCSAQTPTPRYDVIVAGDFRLRSAAVRFARELGDLSAQGRRVAICQLESCRREVVGKDCVADEIQSLLDSGRLGRVFLEQPLECGLLLVRCPLVLHHASARASGIKATEVRVVADVAPSLLDGQQAAYEVARCARTAADLFGCAPSWVAGSPAARAALAEHVPASLFLPDCWEDRVPEVAVESTSGEEPEALGA